MKTQQASRYAVTAYLVPSYSDIMAKKMLELFIEAATKKRKERVDHTTHSVVSTKENQHLKALPHIHLRDGEVDLTPYHDFFIP